VADIVPQAEGTLYYRFGSGPGPWQPVVGPIAIPEGKQLLSAVLVSPDGQAGEVVSTVLRSAFDATPMAGQGATSTATSPMLSNTATYSGGSGVAGMVTVKVVIRSLLSPTVRRLGGPNRYDTAAVIASSGFSNARYVIIATGEKFPDALTASGLAGCLHAPLLLVHHDNIPQSTSDRITAFGATHAIICGGYPAVNKKVEVQLRARGLVVERLSGPNRYSTAVAVARKIQALTGRSDRVYLARGDKFPDALSVAPLAYARQAPILLTWPTSLDVNTRAQLVRGRYGSARIAGSQAAFSSRAEASVRGLVPDVARWAGPNRYATSLACASGGALEGPNSWGYIGIAKGTDFPDALCGAALAGESKGIIALTSPTSLDPSLASALEAHMGDVRNCDIYGSEAAISRSVYEQIRAIFR
jgi:putative cell wall-binding protein